jgi:hypothetical protein
LRYEKTWFDRSVEAENVDAGFTLTASWQWDRLCLDAMIPVDRMWYNGDYDKLDATRTGAILVPRYQILSQESSAVDLTAGVAGFYMHTFLDHDNVYADLLRALGVEAEAEDPDNAGVGPTVGVAKEFSKFTLACGASWLRTWNLDGIEEYPGSVEDEPRMEDHIDVIQGAANLGVPIGENFAINGTVAYTYIRDMAPDGVDDAYWTATLSATWAVKESWAVSFSVGRDFCQSDYENIQLNMGLGWQF